MIGPAPPGPLGPAGRGVPAGRGGPAGCAAVLGVLLLLTASCGIPTDDSPRPISRDALPAELIDPAGTSTTVAEAGSDIREATLYLVRAEETGDEGLVAVLAEVERPATADDLPAALTTALIAARPDQLGRSDLVNALPTDAQVRSATVGDDHVLDLDLTNLGNVQSSLQRLAVAQLVFTLTELITPRIDAIRFSVDGQQVAVPIEGGVAGVGQPVMRLDEPSLLGSTTTTTVGR